MTLTDPDQEALATVVGRGRRAATAAISQVLTGPYEAADPLNGSPTTLLVSTFYTLGEDARGIFREAVGDILARPEDTRRLTAEELSAILYVAYEIELFRRRTAQSKRSLDALLVEANESGDHERASLTLKYLGAARLILRVDEWRRIHEMTNRRHLLACFMGMAQVSIPEAFLWLAEVGNDADVALVGDYAIPGLLNAEGGVDRLRGALQRVQPDLNPSLFERLVEGFGAAIGVPGARVSNWRQLLGAESPSNAAPSPDLWGLDSDFAYLPELWDDASDSSPVPPEVVALFGDAE